MRYLGGFFDDVAHAVTSVVSGAVDVLADIPMAPELYGALASVVNGPLRDFARTEYGQMVLRAIASSVYGGAALAVGPQLASLAFAIPAVANGEDVWTGWASEVQWRAEKSLQILSAGQADVQIPTPAIVNEARELVDESGMGPIVDRGLHELASRLGVSDWQALFALGISEGLSAAEAMARFGVRREDFDPVSGALLRVGARPSSFGFSSARYQMSVQGRAAQGAPSAVFDPGGVSMNVQGRAARYASSDAAPVAAAAPSASPAPSSHVELVALVAALAAAAAWYGLR